MNLKDLAKAAAAIEPNHSILIYGPPKTGKTRLLGTAIRIEEFNRIFWFDLENGSETLLHMNLTDNELEKVTIIKIPDTRDNPIGIETMLRALTSKVPVSICELHGKCDCAVCKKASLPSISFLLSSLTHNDLVVIDSGSQLGDSAMSALCLGKDSMFKPGWDEYGIQVKWLGDICSIIQQAVYTNFAVITHELCIENDEKKDVFYPLMGTKAFCMKVGKYFGTVVYVHKKLNKHAAGSSSTYMGDRVTGSRVNAAIEKNSGDVDIRTIFIEGGILRPGSTGDASNSNLRNSDSDLSKTPLKVIDTTSVRESLDAAAKIRTEIKEETAKPLSFAERMAKAKKP